LSDIAGPCFSYAPTLEIPLEMSSHFAWVYPWWGAFPVFVTVYIPFFAAAVLAHDWPRPRQKCFIRGLFAFDALLQLVFGPILRWIWNSQLLSRDANTTRRRSTSSRACSRVPSWKATVGR